MTDDADHVVRFFYGLIITCLFLLAGAFIYELFTNFMEAFITVSFCVLAFCFIYGAGYVYLELLPSEEEIKDQIAKWKNND